MNYSITNMRASDGSAVRLEYHEALASTLNLAKTYANMDYPDRYAVISENKLILDSFGKVRKKEHGVFISCILRPSIFPAQATLLNPMTAVSLLQGLEEHTEKKLGIGWVGKIYCDGKIIGETSIEGKLDNFTSYEYLIVNFSCLLSEKYFPERISDLIKKVFSDENTSIPLIIAKDILDKFFVHYKNLKSPSKFMDTYRQKFILRGRKASYTGQNGKKRRYKIMGVDLKNCALLLEGRDSKVFSVTAPQNIKLPNKARRK